MYCGYKTLNYKEINHRMKPITNILLVAYLIVYLFLPLYSVDFQGAWTGFSYTADTVSYSNDFAKIAFSLIPFVAGFGGIAVNCMKNRYWGILVAVFVAVGLFFYIDAKDFVFIQLPRFYEINSLGYGFNIGLWLLVASFVSAIVSVLPFKFNKFLAREISEVREKLPIPIIGKHDAAHEEEEKKESETSAPVVTEGKEAVAEPETSAESEHERYMPKQPKSTPDEN